jgi:hypothetical protein
MAVIFQIGENQSAGPSRQKIFSYMRSQVFICCGALLLIMEIKEGGGLKMDFKAKFFICKK